jgi:hypothetical protein
MYVDLCKEILLHSGLGLLVGVCLVLEDLVIIIQICEKLLV